MGMQQVKMQWLPAIIVAGLMVMLLVACAAEAPPLDTGVESNALALAQSEGTGAVLQTQTSEDAEEGQEEPEQSDDVAAAPEQLNACLNCHSDKEQLIATAAPEQEVIEESEGEG